jgi:hypothetical protein
VLAPTSDQAISARTYGYYLNASYSFINSSIAAFITNVTLNMTAYSPVTLQMQNVSGVNISDSRF